MKKKIVVALVLVFGMSSVFSQEARQEREFSTYQEMREYLGKLYEEKKYREAIELLESVLDRFPEHIHANTWNLAFMYIQFEEFDKGCQALQYALDHGVWFGKYDFGNPAWGEFKEQDGFKQIMAQNDKLAQAAQKQAKSVLEVLLPESFSTEKSYPLFIALHGGGGNIAEFKTSWHSPQMKSEFITAYVQSSQMVAMNGYNWTEDIELSKKEIADAYRQVLEKYPVDKDEVIIGGFSSGGVAALEMILSHTVPLSGFIVLCPAKPDTFSAEKVLAAKQRGVRGTLLTTEMDPRLPDQKEMAEVFKTVDIPHQFIVTPDIGHWFPKDLSEKIDEALDHIRKEAQDFPALAGPYLGQRPPGMNPEIFALGIVSKGGYVLNAAFTPDGQEFYFSTLDKEKGYTIKWMRQRGGIWAKPQTAPFSGQYSEADPFISPDGKKLFFPSNRPLTAGEEPLEKYNIWMMERTGFGWGDPRCLDPPINTEEGMEIYPAVAVDGSLYFSSDRDGGKGSSDIYVAKLEGGRYSQPRNLGSSINTRYREFDAFIAPDQSFLVFSSAGRPEGFGRSDLYISFRKGDTNWTPAKNLGKKFNTDGSEFTPMVSPDGKYFFFTSTKLGQGDLYWVNSRVLEMYR